MENLNFRSDGDWFVSGTLDGGSSGLVAFQLLFAKPGAKVVVQTCVDASLGWDDADEKVAKDEDHVDVINGVIEGLNVRIRTSHNPIMAKCTNLIN